MSGMSGPKTNWGHAMGSGGVLKARDICRVVTGGQEPSSSRAIGWNKDRFSVES